MLFWYSQTVRPLAVITEPSANHRNWCQWNAADRVERLLESELDSLKQSGRIWSSKSLVTRPICKRIKCFLVEAVRCLASALAVQEMWKFQLENFGISAWKIECPPKVSSFAAMRDDHKMVFWLMCWSSSSAFVVGDDRRGQHRVVAFNDVQMPSIV